MMGKVAKNELFSKLKWLNFSRVLFSLFLFGSSVVLQISKSASFFSPPIFILYGIAASILMLSFIYMITLNFVKKATAFGYVQVCIDTGIVTLIIYVTGGYSSVFSFLYLVVIIYSSMVLPRYGRFVIAALCSLEYSCVILVEYFGLLSLFGIQPISSESLFTSIQAFYKISITAGGCFLVAFLSGILAEQERKSKRELIALEDNLRRVERMAHMGEMAAGLAHEIKNPLASVSGAIQMLSGELDPESDSKRLIQIALRETDRLSELINNFLLFARPPEGKAEIVDLGGAVEEIASLFEKDLSVKNKILIERKILHGAFIEIDPKHLRQVIWNLFLNASEAIDGEGSIRIEMDNQKKRLIVVKISDNGSGMNKETMDSIFTPFYTTKANGTGLGLSIVQRIVESYNCRLDVDSHVGEGSVFTLNFRRRTPVD